MFAKNGNLYLAQMEKFTPDWSAFTAMNEETWWQLIDKELKGKPLAGLDWDIQAGLKGKPAYHHPERNYGGPLISGRISPDWSIQETIRSGEEPEAAHQLAILALSEGAQSIAFTHVDPLDVPTLTDGILMDVAPVFWQLNPGSDVQIFQEVLSTSAARLAHPDQLAGGWMYGENPDSHAFLKKIFPKWQSIAASIGPAIRPIDELYQLTEQIRIWFDSEVANSPAADGLVAHFEIGSSYLLEITRLRAWRIIWGHLMASYGLSADTPCHIQATIHPDPSLTWESSYIAATTRALSAVMGGVDYLSIIPPAFESPGFAHRIAHHVQHLLKEEGHLHRVMDPLAGSYALEEVTISLAEEAWLRV